MATSSPQARLEARLSREEKDRLQLAAGLEHRSLSEFVIQAALQAADERIRTQHTVYLSERDWSRLLDAIAHPPTVNEALQRALAEHSRRLS